MGVCDTGGPRSNLSLEEESIGRCHGHLCGFREVSLIPLNPFKAVAVCVCVPLSTLPTLTAHLNGLFAAPYLSSPSERTRRRTSPRRAQ